MIEDCVHASIEGFEDCIKKRDERLITAANFISDNISTDRKTEMGKENKCMDISSENQAIFDMATKGRYQK